MNKTLTNITAHGSSKAAISSTLTDKTQASASRPWLSPGPLSPASSSQPSHSASAVPSAVMQAAPTTIRRVRTAPASVPSAARVSDHPSSARAVLRTTTHRLIACVVAARRATILAILPSRRTLALRIQLRMRLRLNNRQHRCRLLTSPPLDISSQRTNAKLMPNILLTNGHRGHNRHVYRVPSKLGLSF